MLKKERQASGLLSILATSHALYANDVVIAFSLELQTLDKIAKLLDISVNVVKFNRKISIRIEIMYNFTKV